MKRSLLLLTSLVLILTAYTASALHGNDPNCPAGANHYVVAGSTTLTPQKDCIGEPMAGGPYHNNWWLSSGEDSALGGSGADSIYGGGGPDHIDGGGLSDRLFGEDGNDTLREGDFGGNDELWGGPQDDVIYGGTGYDGLHGEGGFDRLIHFHCADDEAAIGGFEVHDHRDCP